MHRPSFIAAGAALALAALAGDTLAAQQPPTRPTPAATPQQGQTARRAPRPYAQVITDRAVTDVGGITVHHVEDRWFVELPDSLLRRDFLLVSRIAGVPTRFEAFIAAGSSVAERVVRWEKQGDRVVLRTVSFDAVAADSLPIARSVASNNVGAILGAFPVQAYTKDSSSAVLDVTDFFAGDTPAISGLTPAQRRRYQVRRLDPARSFVDRIRSFPLNVEVRHTQTFEATEPPSDQATGTISLEMRQSLVLLPREPMRPRHADGRVGFFTVNHVNYGLDVQKAGDETFIRRWRLEPKDPAAYARGELVEPVKPIIYYIDPATPMRWRRYVKEGVESWQKVFEAAGFKHAIIARDPPSAAEDPDWDPEDVRYSVVRWAASLVRNAVGPSTSDPRTGEIIESDITWYHNHMRSYRNRLMVETGAANPAARTLDIPEELMGETMRQVIAHEVGHAIGLRHNMVASSSFPVDSLRSPTFTHVYGVSPTIMDYARQNYVAQPGDGLAPRDFIRRLGPFDRFIINWGYRVYPQIPTADGESATLNALVVDQKGPMPYRFVDEFLSSVDPRAQTEDVGDDPVKASGYAMRNLKRVVPELIAWTTRPGENYDDLDELYGEVVGMWSRYMGHVTTLIGGVTVDRKTAEQAGAVYHAIPRARQRAALDFLAAQAIDTPEWLAPDSILARIGPQESGASLVAAQSNVVTQLLDTRRLARLADAGSAYPLGDYMNDLRRVVWATPGTGTAPDANRRTLQRVYLERLALIIAPPSAPAATPGGAPPAARALPPILQAPNVPRSDLPAIARAQLRTIRDAARRGATSSTGVARAHWQDVVDRIAAILEPNPR